MEFMGTKEAAENLNVNNQLFQHCAANKEFLMPSRMPKEVLGESLLISQGKIYCLNKIIVNL